MAQIKQELKFYRFPGISAFQSKVSNGLAPVVGYLNRYQEFKQWDDYMYSIFGVGLNIKRQYGPTPVQFFAGGDENAVLDGFNIPYKELTFVVDGEFDSYSRTVSKHNLNNNSDLIYVMDYSTKEPTAIMWSSRNKDLDNTRRLYAVTTTTNAVANLDSVSFYINPQNISIQQRKLWQKIRTRGGWALQHWGPELGTVQIRATTGNIRPPIMKDFSLGTFFSTSATNDLPTELNSPAFAGLKRLEKWYKEDQDEARIYRHELSALYYRNQIYVGHFTDFMVEENAERPFQLNYQIGFTIHYDSTDLQSALTRASEIYRRNKETVEYMERIYEETKTISATSTSTTLPQSGA